MLHALLQTEYTYKEKKFGILHCGHEYHEECVKKWLTVKNNYAICKSTTLSITKKDKEIVNIRGDRCCHIGSMNNKK